VTAGALHQAFRLAAGTPSAPAPSGPPCTEIDSVFKFRERSRVLLFNAG
jgi:hypothetical protein